MKIKLYLIMICLWATKHKKIYIKKVILPFINITIKLIYIKKITRYYFYFILYWVLKLIIIIVIKPGLARLSTYDLIDPRPGSVRV